MDSDAAAPAERHRAYPASYTDGDGRPYWLAYIAGYGYVYASRNPDRTISCIDAHTAYPDIYPRVSGPPSPQLDADRAATDAGSDRDAGSWDAFSGRADPDFPRDESGYWVSDPDRDAG